MHWQTRTHPAVRLPRKFDFLLVRGKFFIMRASVSLKVFGTIAAVLFAAAAPLAGSPLRNSKRLVNEQAVDLHPLFQWWNKHDGPRPLAAWVHVSGSIVGTNAFGWIVEGQLEGGTAHESASNTPGKVVLQNPPLSDLAEFGKLSTQLKTLSAERTQLAKAETQAGNRAQADAKARNANHRNRGYSRALAADERQLKLTEAQAKDRIKHIDQQISDVKKKLSVYPSNDHYAVDCFALETKLELSRMPIYDHGRTLK